MHIILFDTDEREKLFPLTLTRAVADIRMGILTVKERWEKLTNANIFVLTDLYLQRLYEDIPPGEYIFIDARILPDTALLEKIKHLRAGESLADNKGLIAGSASITSLPDSDKLPEIFKTSTATSAVKRLEWPHQMCHWNADMLRFDFDLITNGRTSSVINNSVHLINPANIFVEEGATISQAYLNALDGPIYIGRNATVMEGAMIRGPFALCEGSAVRMGAKIYGATTIGPYCVAGGEIKNSILTAYSNKAHDGYLGDSVIGEWCNLGAGTSNSNVKNTGGEVKIWNHYLQDYMAAGNKCGVIMGDHSRTSINTSINTGTVAGICSNIFGAGLTPKIIPDFAWGFDGQIQYDFDKAMRDISNWKKMKNKTLSEIETQILKHIFDQIKR